MGIFFDHNSTTPMFPEVAEMVRRISVDVIGNPSSTHSFGQRAYGVLEEAREQVARLLQADPRAVVFTSGGTEANNLAIRGWTGEHRVQLVVSGIEHPSVLRPVDALESEGAEVVRVAARPDGVVPVEPFLRALGSRPNLAILMLANNELGTIQPVREVALHAREAGTRFLSDCVQAAGKVEIDFGRLGADAISISAHKMHGPKGVGALIVRGEEPRPILAGGRQERGRRAGTENVAGIAGFGEACRLLRERRERQETHCRILRDHFEEGVLALGGIIFGRGAPRLSNTCMFAFDGVEGQKLVIALDIAGFALSTGSACSSGLVEPSPVLIGCGYDVATAKGAIRFSCGPENSAGDVASLLVALESAVRRMKAPRVTTTRP